MSEELKTYGQIAYEAHAEILGRVDPGATLPAWDDLDADTTNAFMAAGCAVDEQVRTDGIDPGETRLGGILQRLDNLATGMEASARASRPSGKSEIEQGCANAIRGIIGDAQPAPASIALEQLAIAAGALLRLSLIDEMAGMGQRDGDPELTARCRHASRALERIASIGAIPGTAAGIAGDGQQAPHLPADIPLRLARCPEHPGQVHAQAGGAGEWACLRGLADVAEAGVPGQQADGDQQGDAVSPVIAQLRKSLADQVTENERLEAGNERLELEMAEAGAVLAAMAGDGQQAAPPLLAEILAAISKFEQDLAFTAPELIGMRIDQLRSMVRGIFEPEDGEDDPTNRDVDPDACDAADRNDFGDDDE